MKELLLIGIGCILGYIIIEHWVKKNKIKRIKKRMFEKEEVKRRMWANTLQEFNKDNNATK